jgi:hypothetical protein
MFSIFQGDDFSENAQRLAGTLEQWRSIGDSFQSFKMMILQRIARDQQGIVSKRGPR